LISRVRRRRFARTALSSVQRRPLAHSCDSAELAHLEIALAAGHALQLLALIRKVLGARRLAPGHGEIEAAHARCTHARVAQTPVPDARAPAVRAVSICAEVRARPAIGAH